MSGSFEVWADVSGLNNTIFIRRISSFLSISTTKLPEQPSSAFLNSKKFSFIGIIRIFSLSKEASNPNKGKNSYQHINFTIFFLIAVAASLIRASYGIITKMGISSNAEPDIMLLLISLSWIIGGAFYAKLREKRFKITQKKIIYSVVSGVLVFLIVNCLMLALEHGQV